MIPKTFELDDQIFSFSVSVSTSFMVLDHDVEKKCGCFALACFSTGTIVLNGQNSCSFPPLRKSAFPSSATSGPKRGAKLCNWSDGGAADDRLGDRVFSPFTLAVESSAEIRTMRCREVQRTPRSQC